MIGAYRAVALLGVAVLLLALSGGADASPSDEFTYCMRQGKCGLRYLCEYDIQPLNSRGTFLSIENGLDYPVLAKWMIIGDGTPMPTEHLVRIEGAGSRVIRVDTEQPVTLRLFIEDDIVRIVDVGGSGTVCPLHLACFYMMQSCHTSQVLDDSVSVCDRATDYCASPSNLQMQQPRKTCMVSCLSEMYLDELQFWTGDPVQGLTDDSFHTYSYNNHNNEETEETRKYENTGIVGKNEGGYLRSSSAEHADSSSLLSDGEMEMVTCVASSLGMQPVQGHNVPMVGNCHQNSGNGFLVALLVIALVLLAAVSALLCMHARCGLCSGKGFSMGVSTGGKVPL